MTKSLKLIVEEVDASMVMIYFILNGINEYKNYSEKGCKLLYEHIIYVNKVDLEFILFIMDRLDLTYKKMKDVVTRSQRTPQRHPVYMSHEVFVAYLKELDIECLNDLRLKNGLMCIKHVVGFSIPKATIE